MSITKKEVNESVHDRATVDASVKSHANDPFVLKKVERAKEIVSKVGFPNEKKK